MKTENYLKVKLKPLKDRSVRNFHPWVFSGAIATTVKDYPEGAIVEVFDAEDKFLASGHFHHGTIMIRLVTFNRQQIDVNFWINKIETALAFRKGLPFMHEHTNCYRLIHGEGDGLPGLIIDVYGDVAVIQAHSEGMQLAINEIGAALQKVFPHFTTIYNKSAESISKQSGLVQPDNFIAGSASSAIVEEYGNLFYVNWLEGQKTGFFLDQRENRKLLRDYVKGKSVLNTFCYSGGFSIYALKGGAARVDSVDSSKKAIEWTDKNVTLNFPGGAPHESHCTDVFEFMKKNSEVYDVIVLDPPAFAKHLSAVDKAVVGYRNLNHDAIKSVKSGGLIFTFSCSQAIDKQLFRKTVFTAAAKTGRSVRILHQLSQGPDHPISLYHPEGEYLKGLVLIVD